MYKIILVMIFFIVVLTFSLFSVTDEKNRETEELFASQFRQNIAYVTLNNTNHLKELITEKLRSLKIMASFAKTHTDASLSEFIKKPRDTRKSVYYGEYYLQHNLVFKTAIAGYTFYPTESAREAARKGKCYVGIVPVMLENSKYEDYLLITAPLYPDEDGSPGVFELYRHDDIFQPSFNSNSLIPLSHKLINSSEVLPITDVVLNKQNGKTVYATGSKSFTIEGNSLTYIFKRERRLFNETMEDIRQSSNLLNILVLSIIYITWSGVLFYLFRHKRKLEQTVLERTEKLEHIKTKFQNLFTVIPDYAVVHDEKGRILEYNNRMSIILRNLETSNFFEIVQETNRYIELLTGLTDENSYNLGEFGVATGENSIMTVSIISTMFYTGETKLFLTIVRDLSELKKFQELFFQAQKQEALGTLTSGLSHDFKNILQNINIYNQLIENSASLEEAKENAGHMKEIVMEANTFVKGMLEFFKDKRKDFSYQNVGDAVEKALKIISHAIPRRIKLTYTNNAKDVCANIVESRMIQAIINLCMNSVDAIEHEGEINVSVKTTDTLLGEFVEIYVTDTGCGIDAEHLDEIFNTFFTTKGDTGTGLGLTSVRKFIMDAGGFVDVNSKIKEGTTFKLSLPVVK